MERTGGLRRQSGGTLRPCGRMGRRTFGFTPPATRWSPMVLRRRTLRQGRPGQAPPVLPIRTAPGTPKSGSPGSGGRRRLRQSVVVRFTFSRSHMPGRSNGRRWSYRCAHRRIAGSAVPHHALRPPHCASAGTPRGVKPTPYPAHPLHSEVFVTHPAIRPHSRPSRHIRPGALSGAPLRASCP